MIATAALAYWLAVAYIAADVACAESGHDYRDGAHVLAVVRARARSDWARYDGTLLDALTEPHQHAHGCRAPITWRHGLLGVQFIADTLPVEPWARDALWYCGDYDAPETCEARGAVLLGTVRHSFWRRVKKKRTTLKKVVDARKTKAHSLFIGVAVTPKKRKRDEDEQAH